jgi:hypothetical protein
MNPSDPIAFFITWTCYGTWLPGDERGWTRWHHGDQLPRPRLANWCAEQMKSDAVVLTPPQREIVETVVTEHCSIRNWILHRVNCRTNHCHVVVTAPDYDGEIVREQFKSWAKRKLKAYQKDVLRLRNIREKWFTRKGSVRYLFDDDSLASAILYSGEVQDIGGSKTD